MLNHQKSFLAVAHQCQSHTYKNEPSSPESGSSSEYSTSNDYEGRFSDLPR